MKIPQKLRKPLSVVAAFMGVAGIGAGLIVGLDSDDREKVSLVVDPQTPVEFKAPNTERFPDYRIAHIENIGLGLDPQELEDNEFYGRHAEAAAQILSDSYMGRPGPASKEVGYISASYCDGSNAALREFYTRASIVNVSSYMICQTSSESSEDLAFWRDHSPTLLFKSAGNYTNSFTENERFTSNFSDYNDTMIRVGQMTATGGIPGSSSAGADIMEINPFYQGFAFPMYMTEEESRERIARYEMPEFDAARVSPQAGEMISELSGTSFSTPRLAGEASQLLFDENGKVGYPTYVVWAAILAGGIRQSIANDPQYQRIDNARGLSFESRRLGFGIADMEMTRDLLNYDYGEDVMSVPQYQRSDMRTGIVNGNSATFNTSADMISGTIMGEITIRPDDVDELIANGMAITSPSGTSYAILLRRDPRPAENGLKRYFFRTTGFLGEDNAGEWSISVTNGSMVYARLYNVGFSRGGIVDHMISRAAELKASPDYDPSARKAAILDRLSLWQRYADTPPEQKDAQLAMQ